MRQAVLLLSSLLIGMSLQLNPSEADSDFWLAALIGWGGGYLIMLLVASVSAMHPGQSLVGILNDCMGPAGGKSVALLCAALFIMVAGDVIQQFGFYEVTIEIPETPILFIDICYGLIIAYAAKVGLETLGRMSEVFFPVLCLVVLVTLASFFTSVHPQVFLPVLKNGWWKPVDVGLHIMMLPFAITAVCLTVFPHLSDPRQVFRVTNRAALLAGIVEWVIIVRDVAVTGIQLSSRNIFPYEKVFRLMPGIDVYPLLDLDVMMCGILTGALLIFAAISAIGETFGLEKYNVLAFPATGLAVSVSQIYLRSLSNQMAFSWVMASYILPALFALCVILFVVSLMKRPPESRAAPPGPPAPPGPADGKAP